MRHTSNLKKFFVALIISLLFGSGIYLFRPQKGEEKQLLSMTKIIRRDLIQKVTAIGEISAKQTTMVPAPYAGTISKIFVQVGDYVKVGDPLVLFTGTNQTTGSVTYPIRSVVSGTVVQTGLPGDVLEASKALLRIDDLFELYVSVGVPEMDYIKIKKNQDVFIKASAIPDKIYKGKIVTFFLAATPPQGWNDSVFNSKFQVRVKIVNPDDKLHPGMSASVDIMTDARKNILFLPHEFVAKEKEKTFITLKKGDHKEIKLGLQNEEGVEVLSGATEGMEVRQVDFSLFGSNE